MLTGTIVKLDNVSYGSFPTAKMLIQLSTNLVLSFIDFIRTIGINDRKQMANTFASSMEDIEHLCSKCRLSPEANKKESIDYSVEKRKEWQHRVLSNSDQHFDVDLTDVLERTRKRSPFYKIDAFSNEVRYYLISLLKRAINNTKITDSIDLSQVDQIIANCCLEPIRSWGKARQDSDYVRELLTESFPHTPPSVVAHYLFTDDNPSPQEITYFCVKHNIRRQTAADCHEEQVAFAKWIGYDADEFIAKRAATDRSWHRYL
ncbi:hypothetical protein IKG06_02980 [Candidatus Saccharibacteria bacterium]|nr:hypothetical protein [Candidatus Saccharibacteria bacterium]